MKRYLILILICIFNSVKGQTSSETLFEIKGTLVDSSSQKPIDYATISLKNSANTTVKTSLTKDNGSFNFTGIKSGLYLLNIITVGYHKKQLSADLKDALKGKLDLGKINLLPSSTNLKEVVVVAEKPIIRQEVDKLVYDLQADPESKSSNVLEIMRKVPLLSVDGEDNILLKGDGNYKILVNGRPSSMMERNARDILKSMPASSIQNIEVITNPPAKYDAEGLAGIINIITNKKVDNGYNGSLSVNTRFPAGGPGLGGSGTFKQGKFGISAYGGANLANNPQISNLVSRSSTGSLNSNLSQIGSRESDSESAYLGTELSLELDSLNLISGQFNINGNTNEGINSQVSELQGNSGMMQRYVLNGLNQTLGSGFDMALNYQLGFRRNKAELLTFSYRYFGYTNEQDNQLLSSERLNYNYPDFRQFNQGSSKEQTFQIDYIKPLKKFSIEGGIKGIQRKNDSDFRFMSHNSTSNEFESDPDRSSLFNNTQQVYGLYNTIQYNLTNWGFKAGYRLEQTIIDADFVSNQAIVKQEYLNLIPSLNINRKFKDRSSLTFAFSQRIQRPGIYQLNPFVDRSNPNLESSGNPDLHPTVGSTYSLGYSRSKKGSFNVMLGYNRFTDLIMPVSFFDPNTLITRTSYDNTGKAILRTLNVNLNYPFTSRFNVSMNGGLAYGNVSGIVNEIRVENKGFMYNTSTNGSYRLDKGWRLNYNLNLNGPNLSLQGTSNVYFGYTLSANKDLVKDKLSFSAALNNPFQKYRTRIRESFGPDFNQQISEQQFYRSFNTSLNYRFGKLKSSVKKNTRGIRNDDVTNSSN